MQNKLPQFEANQVLSSEHLNQIINYLEEQSRLTRNHLLGSGIVSGLDVKRTGAGTITISEGVGVTSAGYLVIPESSNFQTDGAKRVISYNKKQKFNPKFLLFPYKGDSVTTFDKYDLFNGLGDIFQLVETSVADDTDPGNVTLLTAGDLDNKVLVLFLQIRVKELKSCENDSCMELGKEWTYSAVPLLLSKGDANLLLQAENVFNPAVNAATNVDPFTNAGYYLPDLAVRQAVYTDTAIKDNASIFDIQKVYRSVLEALRNDLTPVVVNNVDTNKFSQIDVSLKRILKTSFTTGPIAALLAKLNQVLNDTSLLWKYEQWQYLYGFVTDIACAYQELQDAVFELSNYEVPKTDSYPHHLRLGLVPAPGNAVTSLQFPPNTYRHGFTYTLTGDDQRQAQLRAVWQYQRLLAMINNLNPALKVNDIRITPGARLEAALSLRPVPFYYAPVQNLKKLWNPDWTLKNKASRVLNYYENAQTADPTKPITITGVDINSDKALYQPLSHYQADNGFYRIEGHIGAPYTDVFKTVSDYTRQYGLSFDLQLVRLNKNTVMLIKDKHILFSDLESMHAMVVDEIECLLQTELNYFSNIKLTRTVTNQQQTGKLILQSDELLFHQSSGTSKSSTQFFNVSQDIKMADLGVTDSLASFVYKYSGVAALADIADILITTNFGISQTKTTAAAAFITKMVTSINELFKVLAVPFYDFKIDDYEAKLNALDSNTKSFTVFAKNQSDALLKNDNNLVKGEVLDYLDRILYECDFEKLFSISREKARREEQVGVNNYLQQYIQQHPGIRHAGGAPAGGTFVVVFNEQGSVIADYCLPYRCCAGGSGTQFVLGVLKTILISGQVVNAQGNPVPGATVTLNNETLPLDKNSRFQKAVTPNSLLILKVSAPGFEARELQITAGADDILQDVTLFTKEQEQKVNFTLTVAGPDGKPVAGAAAKLNDTALTLDATGTFKGTIKASAAFTLTVTAPGFKTYTEVFSTALEDKTIKVALIKSVSITGTIVGPDQKPVLNASVFINGTIVKTAENKFELKDVAGNQTFNLVIEADGMEKYSETLSPNSADIAKTFQLVKAATFTAKVGVYVPSKPIFRIKDLNLGKDIIGSTGKEAEATDFEFLENNQVSTLVDNVAQGYDAKLRLFASEEKKASHKLVVKIKPLNLTVTGTLSIVDKDVLVLIPAKQNYKPVGVFTIVVTPDRTNLQLCNTFLAKQFSLPEGAVIENRAFEIRFFTSEEAAELAGLMKAARIKFITMTQSRIG